MPTPPLTTKQRKSFEEKFTALFATENNAATKWDGEFNWILDVPKLDHVVKYFSERGKDKFAILLNRIKNRTI